MRNIRSKSHRRPRETMNLPRSVVVIVSAGKDLPDGVGISPAAGTHVLAWGAIVGSRKTTGEVFVQRHDR